MAAAPARAAAGPRRVPRRPGGAQHAFLQRARAGARSCAGLRAAERHASAHAQRAQPPLRRLHHLGQQRLGRVAPERSATGNALLWGGPQEGFDNPNIDWEGYILSPHMKAGGMMIAGVPGVLIGQTTRFAFTTTSGEIDNSTLYVETLQAPAFPEPQSDSASYAFLLDGAYHPMDRRTEVVPLRRRGFVASRAAYAPGGPANGDGPLLFNVFRVNDCDPAHFHGYVLEFDLARVAAARLHLQDGVLEERAVDRPGLPRLRARHATSTSSRRSVDQVVSLHNFFYADRRGNIAYWSAGARPAFPAGFDDRLPADGTGSQEWGLHPGGQRYLPFSRSLVSTNPTQGWLANWNTKPADRPYIQEGNSHDEHWGEIYRSTASRSCSPATRDDAEGRAGDRARRRLDGRQHRHGARGGAVRWSRSSGTAYDALRRGGEPAGRPATHPTLGTAVDGARRVERLPGGSCRRSIRTVTTARPTARRAASPACRSSSSGGTR